MRFAAMIVAAGSGQRLGGKKQFWSLGGQAVYAWSLGRLQRHPEITTVIMVVPAEDRPRLQEELGPEVLVVAGGAERFQSVQAGLNAVPPDVDRVLIHDAARPGLSEELLTRVLAAARQHPAVIPVLPVADTVKAVDGAGRVRRTVDRQGLYLVQTPQAFDPTLLRQAYQALGPGAVIPSVTDDAAAVERLGQEVWVVSGEVENFKVTSSNDWAMAQRLWSGPPRVGFGYDVHRLVTGRPLILGGVNIPWERGLEGHSDADVLIHALMDACLGAAGEPDIGHFFPPGDPAYRGASSLDLLAQVRRRLAEISLTVLQADLTLVAEAPRLGPYFPAMRERLCETLDLSPGRLGLKATTNEGLGFLGRGEGLAAWAVAVVGEKPYQRS